MNNVILCGFMGCGKSTVGQLLAEQTGRTLLDTDSFLEQKYGRRIADIFAEDGEDAFRAMETAVCRELSDPFGDFNGKERKRNCKQMIGYCASLAEKYAFQ